MASFNQNSGTIVFPKDGSLDEFGVEVSTLTKGDEFNFINLSAVPSVDTTYIYDDRGYWTGT